VLLRARPKKSQALDGPYGIDYYLYKALKKYKMERKKVAILCENCIYFSNFAEYRYVFRENILFLQ
jgi:hypothetical protein